MSRRAKAAELGAIPLPMMQYSDEDMKTISTLKTDLDAYIDQYLAQVATGELDLEESWEEYVATANAMGTGENLPVFTRKHTVKQSNRRCLNGKRKEDEFFSASLGKYEEKLDFVCNDPSCGYLLYYFCLCAHVWDSAGI